MGTNFLLNYCTYVFVLYLYLFFFFFFFWNCNRVNLQRKMTVLCVSFSWIILCNLMIKNTCINFYCRTTFYTTVLFISQGPKNKCCQLAWNTNKSVVPSISCTDHPGNGKKNNNFRCKKMFVIQNSKHYCFLSPAHRK